jgi:hypothetical protein
MNRFLDDFLVGLVLCAGFGYVIYSLGPKSLRKALVTAAAAWLGRVPSTRLRDAAARMAAGTTAGSCGGCGGCGGCGSNAAAGQSRAPHGAPGQGASGELPGVTPEVRVPLSKIGRRR